MKHLTIYEKFGNEAEATKDTIEIGDKIKITNSFGGSFIVEIERVTPTKAISKPYNTANARMEFKRKCGDGWIRLFSPIRWSQTDYKFVK